MKKVISFVLVGVLLGLVCGCQQSDDSAGGKDATKDKAAAGKSDKMDKAASTE